MLLEYSRREVHCTEPCPPLLYTPSSCCSKRKSLSSWSSNALPTCYEVHLICMLPILGVKNPPIVQPTREEALPPVLLLTTCHEGIAAPTHLAICRLLPCHKGLLLDSNSSGATLNATKRRSSPLSEFSLQ